ncbi:MAG: tRNA (cytidine(56)-2'-O)-methyltransferase [Thermoplasmata archaeon]|jgi:tRNA (cytidine56-2'-O)-methyltransferase|nr:tRNA (cytidine(56)-2'-O)-methyltransferase [Thermoplasmata archaeon]
MPRPRRSDRPRVSVLRVGHRAGRDPRLTTHVALAARAFGAERLYLHPPDPALAERVDRVRRQWGGAFAVEGVDDWKKFVREFDGTVVHLTMYGEPLAGVLARLRKSPAVLFVVGGAKVPPQLYGLATHNVAVGHQPHSEVAALAVALAELRGVPGPGAWPGATHVLVPQARGKAVERVPREPR